MLKSPGYAFDDLTGTVDAAVHGRDGREVNELHRHTYTVDNELISRARFDCMGAHCRGDYNSEGVKVPKSLLLSLGVRIASAVGLLRQKTPKPQDIVGSTECFLAMRSHCLRQTKVPGTLLQEASPSSFRVTFPTSNA